MNLIFSEGNFSRFLVLWHNFALLRSRLLIKWFKQPLGPFIWTWMQSIDLYHPEFILNVHIRTLPPCLSQFNPSKDLVSVFQPRVALPWDVTLIVSVKQKPNTNLITPEITCRRFICSISPIGPRLALKQPVSRSSKCFPCVHQLPQ